MIEWVGRSTKNLVSALTVCLLVVILGGYLAFILPGQLFNAELSSLTKGVESAEQNVSQSRIKFDSDKDWFRPSYLTGLEDKLTQASLLLSGEDRDGARSLLVQAKEKQQIKLARPAKAKSTQAQNLASDVKSWLSLIEDSRAQARKSLTEAETGHNRISGDLVLTQKRFGLESSRYLAKYTQPLADSLRQSVSTESEISLHYSTAQGVLPPDEDRQGIGDPQIALDELNKAKTGITDAGNLIGSVSARLTYLDTAEREAKPSVDNARLKLQLAWNTILSINQSRGYSLDKALREAYLNYQSGLGLNQQAEAVLAIVVLPDGKFDYPAAYENALSAAAAADKATGGANEQVRLADETVVKLTLYTDRLNEVNRVIGNSRSSLTTLNTLHHNSQWDSVAGNDTAADQQVTDAGLLIARARVDSSLQNQNFRQAWDEADQALGKLSEANSKAQQVIDLAKRLEVFRSFWPPAESAAQSAISSAEPTVSSYSSYSSRAVSELNQAKSDLRLAQDTASQKLWEQAIGQANGAKSKADNAATWARADKQQHDDDEEAARQRAAEQQSQSNWGTSGWDTGGSSGFGDSGSWGGGSSDSGSWGGGGSDSGSWGGGGSDSSSW